MNRPERAAQIAASLERLASELRTTVTSVSTAAELREFAEAVTLNARRLELLAKQADLAARRVTA